MPWMNLAAAAGGAAARVAVDRAVNYLTRPAPPPRRGRNQSFAMQSIAAALPVTPVARGRGRGRRGRARRGMRPGGQPSSGISSPSGANLVIRDTEILGTLSGQLQVFQFNPAVEQMPRLKQYENMFQRYRYKFVNIAYKSGSATNVAGNIAMGIAPGPRLTTVTDQSTIMKLKPAFYCPIWKNETLNVGKNIDSQKFMFCGNDSADGVSFTLYVLGLKDGGMIQVSYEVEFAFPKPF